jgi:predicted lipid-binding transport protein (Tim44 family)
MPESLDASTIIFALLAIFVLWKLRSVLGSRTDDEKQPPRDLFFRRPPGPAAPGPNSNNDNTVVPLAAPPPAPALNAPPATDRWKPYAEPGSKVAQGLDAIAANDASFGIESFVAGAKAAYDMILAAFAAGDRQTLQNLLDQDVYQSFVAAITAREARAETMKTTVESIDSVNIEEASLRLRVAQITLRIRAKVITATENAEGKVIEGSLDQPVELNDIWTFARDTQSRDPNWKLIATQTGH